MNLEKIIKNHLNGKRTTASNNLFRNISSELKKSGYRAPFKVIAISDNEFEKNFNNSEVLENQDGQDTAENTDVIKEMEYFKKNLEEENSEEVNVPKYKTFDEIDKDKAYEIFRKSYEEATGQSWTKEKFFSRARNWNFYGDDNGFITIRPQRSGLYKLVGMAGNPKSLLKAFDEIKQENVGTWGMVSGEIRNMAEKKGMISPPKWLISLMLPRIPSEVFGGAEIKSIEDDGGVILEYGDIGETKKYFVANKEYYKWIYSQIGQGIFKIPSMIKWMADKFFKTILSETNEKNIKISYIITNKNVFYLCESQK